jgi:hypothetical protein
MGDIKKDGIRVAADFLSLNPDEFRMFWGLVSAEWNDDDSDLEGRWSYIGSHMRPHELVVIRTMLSAISAGQRTAK